MFNNNRKGFFCALKRSFFILFFCSSFFVNAQLIITGKVTDEQNESLPFVNISIKNSSGGTVTDDNGEFKLIVNKKRARIEISFLGFVSQTIKITPRTKYLRIVLKEDANELDEVIIVTRPKKRLRKKENPAYRILKEVWKRKKKNGLRIFDAYQYKKTLSTEIGLNNLDTIFLKNIFKKTYKEILEKLPFNDDGINYYIPLFLNETITNVYGNNLVKKEREDVEAEKTTGIQTNDFTFQRMSNTFNAIDIYKNNIPILKKSFVSPISTTGFETYDYVLQDSTTVDNKKSYHIYFFPRRNGDLAFEGSLWVADKNFSVTKIKMKIRKDINLNFVRKLSFEKEFLIKDDSIYLPKRDFYSGDFTFSDKDEKNIGLSISKINSFSNFEFNNFKSEDFYNSKVVKFRPDQFEKNESYWKSTENSDNSNKTNELISVVNSNKQIQKFTGVFNTLSNGYFNLGSNIQIGQYWNAVTSNSVEGVKLKLGLRTFKTIDDRFRVSSFLAYGTKDKKYKFGIDAKYLISYKPRIGVGIEYLDDTDQLGGKLLNTNGLNANAFDPNALFSRGDNFFLSAVKKSAIKFDIQLKRNLHVGFSFAHNKITTASPENFTIDYLSQNGTISSQVTDVNSDLYIAYAPGRFEYGYGIEQKMGKNLFPSMIINYRKGYKGILNGTHSYDKIQFSYNHPILLGKLGLMIATINGGKTFGTVPLSLLSPIPANQTFWITRGTFSLMNYYDFVTDTYISGHFEQHFDGLILNKIPLLKKLKLRSLISFKTVYGTISKQNIAINRSNVKYTAPTDRLYYEYGFGLENIGYENIRPLRVDFVWRGDHKSINGLPSPKFAIRIGIRAGL
jgi:hypothetical protein